MTSAERLAKVSLAGVKVHAHPVAQLFLLASCGLWFAAHWDVGVLTNILSVWAMLVALMILTDAKTKECSDAQRDTAIQAKLDELISALPNARDELKRSEEKPVEEIEATRD